MQDGGTCYLTSYTFVRSKRCRVIAKSKIADTCEECEALKDVSINRSVLSSEKQQSTRAAQGHQKSVWQGCEISVFQLTSNVTIFA